MKSVAFYISTVSASGGTQRLLALLGNLLIKNHQVVVFVNKKGEAFYQLDPRIKIELLPANLIKKNHFVYKYLKKHQISHFISLDSNSVLFCGFLLPRGTRLIVWEHFALKQNFKKFHLRLSRFLTALRADKLVVLSEIEGREWQEKYWISTSRVRVIENPLTSNCKIDTSNKYHHKQVLAIGNNIQVKGFDLLIQAWLQMDTDWHLAIVGLSKKQIEELTARFNLTEIPNIRMFERTSEIEQFYSTSSIFVLSSRKEASPLVLIESQSFGIPAIIFSHLQGAIELINDSALLCDFSDPVNELKAKLTLLIQDEVMYNRLRDHAIDNSKRFDVNVFHQKWCELLEIGQ
jgi:glycosyltransferase involved in cell wall biosynthesis